MTFLTWTALAIAALVAAPVAAHLLRRRPPREVAFAAVALVPESPALARRRSALEDRALFGLRALSVLLLALLGATPFVTCSRLSIARRSGASVALAVVLDDSLSMQAALGPDAPETSRFERARRAANELFTSLEPGDSVSIVLAGAPPRVALAATTNLTSARAALEALAPSERATDLEGALVMAQELLREAPHIDKRVVLLSDRADGHSGEKPLDVAAGLALWAPVPELAGERVDCAVVEADRLGARVTVRVACTPSAEALRRRVELSDGQATLGGADVDVVDGLGEVVLPLPDDAQRAGLRAALVGDDAIAVDDTAPVAALGSELVVGIVADPTETAVATGGAPPVEQALTALQAAVHVQPLPAVPEHESELADIALLVADDVPGFTPESRRELGVWLERGGVMLLTLGPHAAMAPLGSGFAPMLPALVRWGPTTASGVGRDESEILGASAGATALKPVGRAQLDVRDGGDDLETLVSWDDGAPLLLHHRVGRGSVFALTLPLATAESDFALRPGFLSLLKHLVDTARALRGVGRSPVGSTWSFEGFREVKLARVIDGAPGRELVPTTGDAPHLRAVPDHVGLYELELDGQRAERIAAVVPAEVDLRPRPLARDASGSESGGGVSTVDISAWLALALLALAAGELVLRVLSGRAGRDALAPAPAAGSSERPAA